MEPGERKGPAFFFQEGRSVRVPSERGCQRRRGKRLPWAQRAALAFASGSPLGLPQVPELSLQPPRHVHTAR